jgi:hypothetical protein
LSGGRVARDRDGTFDEEVLRGRLVLARDARHPDRVDLQRAVRPPDVEAEEVLEVLDPQRGKRLVEVRPKRFAARKR